MASDDSWVHAAQSHRSDPRILNRRTLEHDHRTLAGLLRPGLLVLDIGCGPGAITAGIAKAVGPHGQVVGIDREDSLLELARATHASVSNLRFELGDATTLNFHAQFDIVSSARTLQWIANPALAISKMKDAAKIGGMVVALDYNHVDNDWEPKPPPEFRQFYKAFLAWREANGWDNAMADHIPQLFRAAGLVDVNSLVQDEIVERGAADFTERTALWSDVIEKLGEKIAAAGFLTTLEVQAAGEGYREWAADHLSKQLLALHAVTGRVVGGSLA